MHTYFFRLFELSHKIEHLCIDGSGIIVIDSYVVVVLLDNRNVYYN